MATLIITDGPANGEQFALEEHRIVLLGRDADCNFQILDTQISRRHMQVQRDDQAGGHLAVDFDSRNGVMVNGDRIAAPTVLNDGDEILIGETRIIYASVDSPDAKSIDGLLRKRGERRKETFDNK